MINFEKKILEIIKERNLSTKDIERMKIGSDTSLDSYHKSIGYCQSFIEETVLPTMKGLLNVSNLEKALQGLFYRLYCLNSSILKLNQITHFQTITSSSRTLYELYLDTELLVNSLITNGIEKYYLFSSVQKLKSAKKIKNFFKDKNIDFDYSKHEQFLINNEESLKCKIGKVWGINKNGNPKYPQHWSGLNTCDLIVQEKLINIIKSLISRIFMSEYIRIIVGMFTLTQQEFMDSMKNIIKV